MKRYGMKWSVAAVFLLVALVAGTDQALGQNSMEGQGGHPASYAPSIVYKGQPARIGECGEAPAEKATVEQLLMKNGDGYGEPIQEVPDAH